MDTSLIEVKKSLLIEAEKKYKAMKKQADTVVDRMKCTNYTEPYLRFFTKTYTQYSFAQKQSAGYNWRWMFRDVALKMGFCTKEEYEALYYYRRVFDYIFDYARLGETIYLNRQDYNILLDIVEAKVEYHE